MKLEPDSRPGQVIAVQRRRNLVRLPEPHGFIRGFVPNSNRLPTALVQAHRLAVRQVSGVHLPRPIRQLAQFGQPLDHRTRRRRQPGANLGCVGSALSSAMAREEEHCSEYEKQCG